MKMNDVEYNPFSDKKYYDMWGVNTEEKLHFYYDESNNCRKFWLDTTKNSFNHDFMADFVLAGIASESNSQIPFDELKQRFGLQKNAVELKSKSMFHGKDFLQCIGTKQATALFRLFSDYDLYMHYSHVNNFYYTIVEIFDSITDAVEINNMKYDYFALKTTFYNMLLPNIEKVTETMIKYSYPNIKTESISDFCNDLLNSIDPRYKQKPDEIFLTKLIERASRSSEMVFIQNNEDYIMQENYMIFYVNSILKFPKGMHHFDEELSIQSKVDEALTILHKEDTANYEFVNSKNNTMIQISDLVAGLLGKMFTFINSMPINTMVKTVKNLSNVQVDNCLAIQNLRLKSDLKNKGLIQSIAPIGIGDKLNDFFNLVLQESWKRIERSND